MATVSQTIPVAKTTPRIRERGPEQPVSRNVSIDAYRGFVMLLMMAEVLQLSRVAAAYPTSFFWKILAFNQTHVEWFGCSLHDTIQPGFLSLSAWRCRTRLPVASRRVRASKNYSGTRCGVHWCWLRW